MKANLTVQHILPTTEFTCFVIPTLFSDSECQELLSNDIKHSFEQAIANYPTYYRNNDRFVIDDDNLSKQLFDKVAPYLPKTITTDNDIEAEKGIWHLKELNNRLRFCKYSANQYFNRHLDGVHYHDEVTQSKLTFMIYLNDATEFKDGRTLFYESKEATEEWAAYTPRKGDLIVFDHNVWHSGEMLTAGEKFVLRSDILYFKEQEDTINKPFSGHLGYIWDLLCFDNQHIISGGRDKEIKVLDATGTLIHSLTGHQNSILCIEKINNSTFISGSRDQQILVWQDYKLRHTIKQHTAIILSLCRLDEHTFVSSSGDNSIKISKLDGTVLRSFYEHTNWVWQVIKLADDVADNVVDDLADHIIASCSEDGSIKIWNCHSDNSMITFKESASIISLAYNSSTRQLISGNLHGDICIRTLSDTYDFCNNISFNAHTGIIRTIKIIDDTRFATGGEDNKVKIWTLTDTADGTPTGELLAEFEHHNFVQAIEILDTSTLISASYDGTIKLCDC